MRLFYCQSSEGIINFGDDLNPWLWNLLLPGTFTQNSNTAFIGIGTILNDKLPRFKETHVFSSGVGYGKLPEHIDNTWKFHCVRGPLSANRLGISPKLAITDGALLVKKVYSKTNSKRFHRSYMPHVSQANAAVANLCKKLDLHYIDPSWPITKTLQNIDETEILYTEAMHGAIVADTLRVPWIAIKTMSNFFDFKWHDWGNSLDVSIKFHKTLPIWNTKNNSHLIYWKQSLKTKVISLQLQKIIRTAKPQLSEIKVHTMRFEQLQEKIEHFKKNITHNCSE